MDRDGMKMEETEYARDIRADVVIVGTGAAGLFAALSLPKDRRVVVITKSDAGSAYSVMTRITTAILRIRCARDIMRIGKNR